MKTKPRAVQQCPDCKNIVIDTNGKKSIMPSLAIIPNLYKVICYACLQSHSTNTNKES